MKNPEIFVEASNRGKPPVNCPIGKAGTITREPLCSALSVRRGLLAVDERENISLGYFC